MGEKQNLNSIDIHELINNNGIWGCTKCYKIWYYEPSHNLCYGPSPLLTKSEKRLKKEMVRRKVEEGKSDIWAHS